MTPFAEAVGRIAHTDVSHCYQCGRCSGNCPMAAEMDLLPHQVVRMCQYGAQEVLDAESVWLCDGCHTCSDRCPREIEVAAIFDALRQVTVRRDTPLAAFNRSLLTGIRRMGRVNEMPLGIHFNLTSKRGLFSGLGDAIHLFRKGKLHVVPRSAGSLARLFSRAEAGDGE